MKTKRSKSTNIPMSVKRKVWERDNHCCIICGNNYNVMPNAHFIPLSYIIFFRRGGGSNG